MAAICISHTRIPKSILLPPYLCSQHATYPCNERQITQCRRCRAWGHATTNYHRNPKCVKCGKGHWTREGTLKDNALPMCANCDGNHTASNLECPVYQYRVNQLLEGRQTNNPTSNPTYVPEPPPKTNAWEARKNRTIANVGNQIQQNASPTQPGTSMTTQTTTSKYMPTPTDPNGEQQSVSAPNLNDNDFYALMHEMKTLNSRINLKETITAIAELNKLLKNKDDPVTVPFLP